MVLEKTYTRMLSARHDYYAERRSEMMRMRAEGKTLQEIGNHFDMTRERVRQIIGNTGRIPTNGT